MQGLKRKLEEGLHRDEDAAKGKLTAVTRFLASHFKAFDADAVSKNCAGKGNYTDCKTSNDVLVEWERRRMLGKDVHHIIEDYLVKPDAFEAGDDEEDKSAEMLCFRQFRRWFEAKKYAGFKAEYKVFDLKGGLVGVIDLIAWDAEGKIYVIDFKVTEDISDKAWDDAKGIVEPCTLLPDSAHVKASLQVHLYAQLLRLGHNVEIADTILVQLFPLQPEAREVPVLPLSQYALKMISRARLQNTVQKQGKRRRRW